MKSNKNTEDDNLAEVKYFGCSTVPDKIVDEKTNEFSSCQGLEGYKCPPRQIVRSFKKCEIKIMRAVPKDDLFSTTDPEVWAER